MGIERLPAIALVGYRGSGKTTVGRILAHQLDWEFADADAELERRLGRTIPDLFAREGEATFRDEEERTLAELCRRKRVVLATGGGAVLRATNRLALKDFGAVVWLRAKPDALARRLQDDRSTDRPALTPLGVLEEIRSVLAAREPLYREVAHAVVPVDDRTPEEVADRILESLGWEPAGPGGRVP
jgi:shikimate kinase